MVVSNLPQREEYLRKKRKRRWIRVGILFGILILLIGIASFASHRKEGRISEVELSGGVLVTKEEVQTKTLSFLSGSYFWLFPKDNTFLYRKTKLENFLKDSFKRIDTIEIKKKGLRALSITITERKPYAIWCDNITDEAYETTEGDDAGNIEEKCYFMDQNSTIFAPAPNFSGDAYFKYYGLIKTENPIGMEYMSSTTRFAELSDFVTSVKSISLRPLYVVAKDDDEFSMVLNSGAEILFDTKDKLSKVFLNLQSLLETPELASLNKQNLQVEYLDLRFGNKLFYKLRQ